MSTAGVFPKGWADANTPVYPKAEPPTTRSRGSSHFHAILAELGALHDRKQADYGRSTDPFANIRASAEWGVAPWIGALIRGTDKLRRLQTYAHTGTLANEGVEDSLLDLAVYAVISLVLFRESHGDRHPQ